MDTKQGKPESMADIIAEKRRRADEIERDVDARIERGEMISRQYADELVADMRAEANRLEAAWEWQVAQWAQFGRGAMKALEETNGHPYADYGDAGVATVHHYEVREMVAGRCNLVATFTDPHRAAEYAKQIAGGLSPDDGNNASLRGALLRVRCILSVARDTALGGHMVAIIDAALNAPARNCDVGTAKEQEDRFNKYCRGSNYCAVCPIRKLWDFQDGHSPSCTILWSQMPYEAEKGGAE